LCLLALLGAGAGAASASAPDGAPVYTNADLERVHERRAETGVLSEPPATPASPAAPARREEPPTGRGEEYWRDQAERVQDRVAELAERAAALRARVAEKRRRPGVLPYSDPQIRAWTEQAERLEARARQVEERLHDRARRAGALPGWLR